MIKTEIKDNNVIFRISTTEKETIRELAEKRGQSITDFFLGLARREIYKNKVPTSEKNV